MSHQSILISGNLKKKIVYPLTNFNILAEGTWLISVNSISFKSNQNISKQVSISCNLSHTSKFSKNSQIIRIEQPFSVFRLETSPQKPSGLYHNGK